MAISDSISPLDDGFVRFGHIAMLMAEENEQRAYEDITDRLKRAVFAGEFEPPHISTPNRDNPVNWLRMEIVIPPFELTRTQAKLDPRPKRFYGVGRETIVSVLYTSDALPGATIQRSMVEILGSGSG